MTMITIAKVCFEESPMNTAGGAVRRAMRLGSALLVTHSQRYLIRVPVWYPSPSAAAVMRVRFPPLCVSKKNSPLGVSLCSTLPASSSQHRSAPRIRSTGKRLRAAVILVAMMPTPPRKIKSAFCKTRQLFPRAPVLWAAEQQRTLQKTSRPHSTLLSPSCTISS